MSQSIEARVRAILIRTFNLTEAQASNHPAMGELPAWDSLGHMQLMASVEKEFGIQFPAFALTDMTSVPAIVQELKNCGVH